MSKVSHLIINVLTFVIAWLAEDKSQTLTVVLMTLGGMSTLYLIHRFLMEEL